jgi:exosortase/archaeosortase family protein
MVYSCIGYGVMSFWVAFIFANKGTFKKKFLWISGGILVLWIINVLRVSLLLLAINKNWKIPLGWDHHTWFNIVAYSLIFLMILLYDRSFKRVIKSNVNTYK